jgi:carbon monoxide dehydrogenase subunit G
MRTLETVDVSFFQDAPTVIRSEVIIAAPRSAVFAKIATDPAGWGDWFPGFSHDGEWETAEPHGVGSVRQVRAFRTGYRETMLVWDEGQRWAFRVDASNSPLFAAFAEDYSLADDGSGTRLTWTVAFKPRPAMRLVAPLAPAVFRQIARRVASGLTRVAAAN